MPPKKSAPRAQPAKPESPARLIDARIKELPDWRGEVLSRMRRLIQQADPEVVEEWKWRGVPVWSHDGIICTGETYIKLAFFRGTSLRPVPPIESKQKEARYFHIHEADPLDEELVASWIRQASELPGWVP